jgi:hypothetical protein
VDDDSGVTLRCDTSGVTVTRPKDLKTEAPDREKCIREWLDDAQTLNALGADTARKVEPAELEGWGFPPDSKFVLFSNGYMAVYRRSRDPKEQQQCHHYLKFTALITLKQLLYSLQI